MRVGTAITPCTPGTVIVCTTLRVCRSKTSSWPAFMWAI